MVIPGFIAFFGLKKKTEKTPYDLAGNFGA